jgi:hypothetical protein
MRVLSTGKIRQTNGKKNMEDIWLSFSRIGFITWHSVVA